MTTHIQGPWRTDAAGGFPFDIHDQDDVLIARVQPSPAAHNVARRIVACVNACEGIDTDWLEGGCTGWLNNTREERGQYQRERDAALRQRDELLAALEETLTAGINWYETATKSDASELGFVVRARAAIAKAKGEP